MGYIHFPLFLISLSIGLLYVYMMGPEVKEIPILPNPDNLELHQIKDESGTCHHFKAKEVSCSKMKAPEKKTFSLFNI